jgi:nucleoporin NDC1
MSLIQKPIFKPSPQSPIRTVLDSFAADGAVSQVVADTAEASASHMPQLFRSVEGIVGPLATPAVESVNAKKGEVEGLVKDGREAVMKLLHVPPWAKEVGAVWASWWKKEKLGKVVEGCLPFRELDALVVDGK